MQEQRTKIRGTWYLDSGCSSYMTGDTSLFTKLEWKEKGYVKFGDDSKCKIIASDMIGHHPHVIENVSLVKGLKHNLLSISQLCEKKL